MSSTTSTARTATETDKAGGSRPTALSAAALSAAALERVPAGTTTPIALGTATNAFFTILR